MVAWRRRKGDAAEQRARQHLQRAGLQFEAANLTSRFGEIDLLMRDGDTLVIVEVRQRASNTFGGAAASVTASKQRKLIQATRYLLSQRPALAKLGIRFDVVTLSGEHADDLAWIKNAFDAY